MRRLKAQELQAYLAQAPRPPLLLDVREPWEYGICSLPGSRLLPMAMIPSSLEQLDPEQEIVVICHHGIRSRQVALFLERSGFPQVINLEGGINGWAREVDRQMPTY
jgi:rhodanese-related sulfurtransferase